VRTSYNGFFFVTLKPWDDRKLRDEQFQQIKMNINRELSQIPEGIAFSFFASRHPRRPVPPAVSRSSSKTAPAMTSSFLPTISIRSSPPRASAPKSPASTPRFLPSVPQQFVDVDRDKVIKQGVAVNDVYKTLQAFMGGLFINYFNRFGRQWQVYIEAEGEYRTRAENVGQFFVKNNKGRHGPLAARHKIRIPPRARNSPCASTNTALPKSTAQRLPVTAPARPWRPWKKWFAQTMPREMGYDYLGMSFQEKKAQEGVPASAGGSLSLSCSCS